MVVVVVVVVVMAIEVNPFDEEVTIITAKYEDGQFVKKFSQKRTEYMYRIRFVILVLSIRQVVTITVSLMIKPARMATIIAARILTLKHSILMILLVTV